MRREALAYVIQIEADEEENPQIQEKLKSWKRMLKTNFFNLVGQWSKMKLQIVTTRKRKP